MRKKLRSFCEWHSQNCEWRSQNCEWHSQNCEWENCEWDRPPPNYFYNIIVSRAVANKKIPFLSGR
jgi:hypothetical protein